MSTDELPSDLAGHDALSIRLRDLVDAVEAQVSPGRPPRPVHTIWRPTTWQHLTWWRVAGPLAVAVSVVGILGVTLLLQRSVLGRTAVVPADQMRTVAPLLPPMPSMTTAPPSVSGSAVPSDATSAPVSPSTTTWPDDWRPSNTRGPATHAPAPPTTTRTPRNGPKERLPQPSSPSDPRTAVNAKAVPPDKSTGDDAARRPAELGGTDKDAVPDKDPAQDASSYDKEVQQSSIVVPSSAPLQTASKPAK